MPDGKQSRASLLLVIRRLQRDVHVTIRIRTDDDLRRVFFSFSFSFVLYNTVWTAPCSNEQKWRIWCRTT